MATTKSSNNKNGVATRKATMVQKSAKVASSSPHATQAIKDSKKPPSKANEYLTKALRASYWAGK